MAGPSSLKALNSIHVNFSMKSTPSSSNNSSSSSLSSMKLKTLLQTFIFSHIYRIDRALTKAKSVLIQLLKDIHLFHLVESFPLKKNKQKKLFFGSFRLHYNWCSSNIPTVPAVLQLDSCSNSHVYFDSNWNSVINPDNKSSDQEMEESCPNELTRYLQWLEEKGGGDDDLPSNEIDRLADLFIANCHEKFRLEKVESYRRFQEMMARSV